MSAKSAVLRELTEHVESLEAEAYQRGWNDAMAAVVKAADQLCPFDSVAPQMVKRGLRANALPALVLEALGRHPFGASYDDVEDDIAHWHAETVKRNTLRSAVLRLAQEGRVKKDGELWFLRTSSDKSRAALPVRTSEERRGEHRPPHTEPDKEEDDAAAMNHEQPEPMDDLDDDIPF